MDINLYNLERAMNALENLPNMEIVKQHPDATELATTIRNESHMAMMILQEAIELLKEKATLQNLINQKED